MAKSIPAIITPAVLSWARQLDQITIDEVADKIKVPSDLIQNWENGSAQPSFKQAKDLAKYYRVPFAFFFLPSEPKGRAKRINKVDYRTFGNIGDRFILSRELRWLLRDVEDRRDAVIDLLEIERRKPNPFLLNADPTMTAKEIAEMLRNTMKLTDSCQRKFRKADVALAYCVEELEKKSVLVFQSSKIDPKEMRGISAAYDTLPYIVLNRKDETSARLFTLCHELAHIAMRSSGICNDVSENSNSDNATELLCNEIAGLTLVPDDAIKTHNSTEKIRALGFSDVFVGELARDFAVSTQVIINRLWKVGVLSKDFYFATLQRYKKEYERIPKKASGYVPPAIDKGTQVGKLYTRMVLNAYHSESITTFQASSLLLNLNAKHFDSIERWCK